MTIGNIHIKNKYIWITTIAAVVITVILLLNWIINSSFIEVNITNGGSGSYKYSFLNQASNKNTEVITNNSQIKQLLPTNSYNFTVQQNYNSYFTVVKTDNFLANTYIENNLLPENKREFVGNNPSECMSYVNNVLVSFGCNDLLANALVHIPATSTIPTYTTTTRGMGPAGYYEGILTTNEGSFSLSHIPISSENGQTHLINMLGNNFTSTSTINITVLNPELRYKATNYKTGFIAYNQNFSEIQYFPSIKNQATNIAGVIPDSSYNPISLDVNNETIMTSYAKDNSSFIYFNRQGNINSIQVSKPYNNVLYCGDVYLCMVNNKILDIYQLTDNQLSYLYSVNNVDGLVNINKQLMIVNEFGVVKFNITSKDGYLVYSFGGYKYNSLVSTTNNQQFVLNLTNPKGNKVALLVNPSEVNNDNIDKKVAELQNNPNVKTVSIYKNYITIVPNIPADFNGPKNILDPTKVSQLNQQITNTIKEVGIDTNIYKVNFTVK